MPIYDDNSTTIGGTPLVRINALNTTQATILAKVEGRNPAFSVKCRIGANMIWEAEKSGALTKGKQIVEPTSGNTGIALAFVAAARGYPITLTMPDTMSMERRHVLAGLGAKLVLTPGAEGMGGAIRKAQEIAESDSSYFLPQQFSNPANPAIHEKTTGPEIWTDTEGQVDVFVAGVGTGGTISGTTRYLKSQKADLVSVAVEPTESPVITQKRNGDDLKPGPHKIQGIGAGFIPDNLDLSVIDEVVQISSGDAIETARKLMQKEGILCGISSGAAMAAALQLAEQDAYAGKTIVVVLPDLGERYLTSVLFEGII